LNLSWKQDKSEELKYQGDVYPLVAVIAGGQYRIVKLSNGYSARFILTGQTVGNKIGYDPPNLREAKRVCEMDFQAKTKVNGVMNGKSNRQ